MKKLIVTALTISVLTIFTGCGLKGINNGLSKVQEAISNSTSAATNTSVTEASAVAYDTSETSIQEAKKQFMGTGKYRGLEFSASCEYPSVIKIEIRNNSSDGYSLGWVEGSTITCVTSEGEYYYKTTRASINAGDAFNLTAYFDNASGEIEYIYIDNVNALTSSGLPSDANGGDRVEIIFNTNGDNGDQQISADNIPAETKAARKIGNGNFQNLEISVTAPDAQSVTVEYTNNSADGYSLGWVGGPTITCTTTEGEFYFTGNMSKIEAGKSLKENYYFDNATGEIISITISGIHILIGSGLPADFGDGEYVTIELSE